MNCLESLISVSREMITSNNLYLGTVKTCGYLADSVTVLEWGIPALWGICIPFAPVFFPYD